MKQNEIDYENEKAAFISTMRICVILLAILFFFAFISGCTAKRCIVKVNFTNGTYDYYDLNYKPKKDAKSIEYDGQTIIGIESIEYVK